MIRWSALSLFLGIIAFAAIAVLVVVITTQRADLLATVALLLAILSFAAQLIVTASQSQSAESHYRELSKLSTQSSHILQSIEARQNAMIEGQQGTLEKLLNVVIERSTTPEALDDILGAEEDEETGQAGQTPEGKDGALTRELISDEVARQFKAEIMKNANEVFREAAQGLEIDDAARAKQTRQTRAVEKFHRLVELDPAAAVALFETVERHGGPNGARGAKIRLEEPDSSWATPAGFIDLVRVGTNPDGTKHAHISNSAADVVNLVRRRHKPATRSIARSVQFLREKLQEHGLGPAL